MEDNTNLENTQENEVKEETKTYTAEEVQQMIEDGRKQALEEANKRAENRLQKQLKEAEKMAKMNETDRLQYELEQREKAIAEKEHQLSLMENKAEASKILAEKGISVALVDFIVADEAEVMMDNIKLLEAEFKASVKAEVEKRLATTTPKKNLPVEMTKESFQKLSIVERTQLLRNNPELYNKLKGV